MNVTDVLDYDPETGKFTWLRRLSSKICVGQEAGTLRPDGYIAIGVFGKLLAAHRLAWLFHYGKMPDGVIDHINGNPSDNRISNLRDCTRSENQLNRHKKQSSSKDSLPIGIQRRVSNGKYRPYIRLKRRMIPLGTFELLEDAVKARRDYMRKHNVFKHGDA